MSVTNKGYDPNSGVRKITITTGPQLHPLSAPTNAAKNYYCLGLDSKGFQYQIDLQAMPVGVTIEQIQPNQVWWVEKRTSLYRLYLYAGQYDPAAKQVVSTATLPMDPNTPFLTASGGTISGNLVVASGFTVSGTTTLNSLSVASEIDAGSLTVGSNLTVNSNVYANGTITQNGVPVVSNIWSVGYTYVATISGYNTYLIIMTGYGGRTTTGYLTYLFNQSYNASMMAPSTLITLNTYAATTNADYSSSATYVFQPTGGYSTTWYAETVNQNYNTGGATAVVVGLN